MIAAQFTKLAEAFWGETRQRILILDQRTRKTRFGGLLQEATLKQDGNLMVTHGGSALQPNPILLGSGNHAAGNAAAALQKVIDVEAPRLPRAAKSQVITSNASE
jgi:hypothetical protein